MNNNANGQQARSVTTQNTLMQTAEKLIAAKGIENVSIREIVEAAGQKNQSVLQYHFKNLPGLIKAIQVSREQQIQDKRAELLQELLAENDQPTLRDICNIMIAPTFILAKSNAGFRRYILAFSHELALTEGSAWSMVTHRGAGGKSGEKTGQLLRAALPHLSKTAYLQRMDNAVRLISISMGHHARQKSAFRGPVAEYFLSSLIDAIVGLLVAPVSAETVSIEKLMNDAKK